MMSCTSSPEESGHLHGGMIVTRLLLLPILTLAALAVPGRTPEPTAWDDACPVDGAAWAMASQITHESGRKSFALRQ